MPSDSWSAEAAGLLEAIDALRETLLQRRRESPYPWDTRPVEEYNRLLERARVALPSAAARLPTVPATVPSGQQLWRTPTDDVLDALENLRAAILTAHEQPRGTERN